MTPAISRETATPTINNFTFDVPTGQGAVRNSVAQPRPTTVHENPHSTRWFYGAGLLFPLVNARTTGMQSGFVPQGALVAFEDFNIMIDNSNLDADESVIPEEITALQAVQNAIQELSGNGGVLIDALTGKTDNDYLNRLFYVVHPPFAEFGHECPQGLTICPSCRLAFLDAAFIADRIDGMALAYDVDPELCFEVAESLRTANQRLLTHYQKEWSTIKQELEQGKAGKDGAIRILFPEHHYIRQCLHEESPENSQALVAAGYGQQVAAAMQETARQNADVMASAIKEVAASGNDRMATALEAIMQQNQMMMQLLINQQTVAANLQTVSPDNATAPAPAAELPTTSNNGAAAKPNNNKNK